MDINEAIRLLRQGEQDPAKILDIITLLQTLKASVKIELDDGCVAHYRGFAIIYNKKDKYATYSVSLSSGGSDSYKYLFREETLDAMIESIDAFYRLKWTSLTDSDAFVQYGEYVFLLSRGTLSIFSFMQSRDEHKSGTFEKTMSRFSYKMRSKHA